MKNLKLIFDFDSTILKLETIEILADFALKQNKDKEKILNQIKKLTDQAMNGKIDFSYALTKRISLLNITNENIVKSIEFLRGKFSNSFKENIENFNKKNCFIISGGFKEIIVPLMAPFGFKEENIYANNFKFKSNGYAEINTDNDLSKNMGKNLAAKKISGRKVAIGDGYTDYELKKYNDVEIFILFTENIHRKKITNHADYIAKNFKEVNNILKNV